MINKEYISNIIVKRKENTIQVDFVKTTKYQDIIKHVKYNKNKCNIYGPVQTKDNIIHKSFLFNEENLNNLRSNDDELISKFAYEIISKLPYSIKKPFWFMKINLDKEYDENMKFANDEKDKFIAKRNSEQIEIRNEITRLQDMNSNFNKNIETLYTSIHKICKYKSKSIFVRILYSIVSFGLIPMIRSNKNKKALLSEMDRLKNYISNNDDKIKSYNNRLCDIEKDKEERIKNYETYADERKIKYLLQNSILEKSFKYEYNKDIVNS